MYYTVDNPIDVCKLVLCPLFWGVHNCRDNHVNRPCIYASNKLFKKTDGCYLLCHMPFTVHSLDCELLLVCSKACLTSWVASRAHPQWHVIPPPPWP